MVLRKWNSYTPALPASPDDERSRGGGYFIWHNGHGTVIDPGFNFVENFHQAGGRMCDIHNIILTHAHPDHTAEFETLRTLLFEYNDNIRELNKKRATQTSSPPLPLKRVRFFLNNGAFRKFAGMLDLREHEFTDRVFTLNRDSEFDLLGGGRLRVLPAYHDELLSRDQAVGLLLTLGTDGRSPSYPAYERHGPVPVAAGCTEANRRRLTVGIRDWQAIPAECEARRRGRHAGAYRLDQARGI